MKKIIAIFCLVVTSAVLLPLNNTNAHGEDGLTVAGTVDGYTGDVDYAYKVITAGEPGRYTFNLFEGDVVDVAGTGVEYDDVWVRIMQKNESKIG